jgi:hypothetical protein
MVILPVLLPRKHPTYFPCLDDNLRFNFVMAPIPRKESPRRARQGDPRVTWLARSDTSEVHNRAMLGDRDRRWRKRSVAKQLRRTRWNLNARPIVNISRKDSGEIRGKNLKVLCNWTVLKARKWDG